MSNQNFIKVINEEITNFDFLGNEKYLKEQEDIDLMQNEDFQKQFICDSLLHLGNKVKVIKTTDARLGGNWEKDIDDLQGSGIVNMSLEYFTITEYYYDQTKSPIRFSLDFFSNGIQVEKSGWYDKGRIGGTTDSDYAPSGDAWFDKINWSDIEVSLYTEDGDEIQFLAFEKAPLQIQNLFIRAFVEQFIEKYTNMENKDRPNKSAISQYC